MPYCLQCPGRWFVDDAAIQMHTQSKHPSGFECEYCDRCFKTDQGRLAHQQTKHSTSQCRFCDKEFSSDSAREQHEEAKHRPSFECPHCDSKFHSVEARQQHEDVKHPATFGCRLCGRDFASEDFLRQHNEAKHAPYGCCHCARRFSSESTRQQHELDVHYFKCKGCSMSFFAVEALRAHEQTTPHVECSYCSLKFVTQGSKNAHEDVCFRKPIPPAPPVQISRPLSNISGSTETDGEDMPVVSKERSALSSRPLSRSDLGSDDAEMSHSTSGVSSTNGTCDGTIAQSLSSYQHSLDPCTCTICLRTSFGPSNRSPEPCTCTCTICLRTSSRPSNMDPAATQVVASATDTSQEDSTTVFPVGYTCICMKAFDTKEDFDEHECQATAMLQPHCSICYAKFDTWKLVEEHTKAVFVCQLCQAPCCSEEILQDHLLTHPTCSKCGEVFVDFLVLCAHNSACRSTVVCWDCDGIVIETSSLESHYADSPAHPSCAICGVGKRNPADMNEHVREAHPMGVEMDQPQGGDHIDEGPMEGDPWPQDAPAGGETAQPLGQVDRTPLPCAIELMDTNGDFEPAAKLHDSSVQAEPPLGPPLPPATDGTVSKLSECVNGGDVDVVPRPYVPPSPAPSEHGSDRSRSQLLVSEVANGHADDAGRGSPATSVSAEPFSDMSTQSSSSPSSLASNQSIVFISADGIPDYIRENRAVLVATSASSRSSDQISFRLPSESSSSSSESSRLPSLSVPTAPHADADMDVNVNVNATTNVNTNGYMNRMREVPTSNQGDGTYRLHCRICLRDPCEDMTATMCGHIFCKRCITQAVVARSECPVCRSATLLYCLFQLDLSN